MVKIPVENSCIRIVIGSPPKSNRFLLVTRHLNLPQKIISSKFIDNVLSFSVNRQTDRQTDKAKNITTLTDVTIITIEGCIDDERRQAFTSAWWRHCSETVFRDNFVIFVVDRIEKNSILDSVNFSTCIYMQIFNFHYGRMTTFRHPSGAYICQIPGHRLSRLAKGTPSDSWLSIDTIGLG